jgi:hypothetical protein
VVTYGAQAWSLITVDEKDLRVFEGKVSLRMYVPVCIQGEWRLKTKRVR